MSGNPSRRHDWTAGDEGRMSRSLALARARTRVRSKPLRRQAASSPSRWRTQGGRISTAAFSSRICSGRSGAGRIGTRQESRRVDQVEGVNHADQATVGVPGALARARAAQRRGGIAQPGFAPAALQCLLWMCGATPDPVRVCTGIPSGGPRSGLIGQQMPLSAGRLGLLPAIHCGEAPRHASCD